MPPSLQRALDASTMSSSSAGLFSRSVWVARRQATAGESHLQWSSADQLRLAAVAQTDGQFNGTCNASGATLAPQPSAGECESYYSDVTIYCCGAVGGSLITTTEQAVNDINGDGQVSSNELTSREHVSCRANDANDMLLCYKYTAEEHCRSAVSGPWGVCNTADASASSSNDNTATASATSAQQQVSVATGVSNAAPASLHARRWVGGAGSVALYTLLFSSALLLLLGEAAV